MFLGSRVPGIIIDCFGITQLSQLSTVEDVRVLLGIAGYFRKFVPNYSSVLAPISGPFRDSRFHIKRAKRLKVPRSQDQTEATETLVSLLTSPPILRLPEWKKRSRLRTDASETGVGAVLTQIQELVENPWYMQAKDGRRPAKKSYRLIGNV